MMNAMKFITLKAGNVWALPFAKVIYTNYIKILFILDDFFFSVLNRTNSRLCTWQPIRNISLIQLIQCSDLISQNCAEETRFEPLRHTQIIVLREIICFALHFHLIFFFCVSAEL